MSRKFEYTQYWRCPKCEVTAAVPVYEGDGVCSIIHRIEDSHNEKSPDCEYDVMRLQVISSGGYQGER